MHIIIIIRNSLPRLTITSEKNTDRFSQTHFERYPKSLWLSRFSELCRPRGTTFFFFVFWVEPYTLWKIYTLYIAFLRSSEIITCLNSACRREKEICVCVCVCVYVEEIEICIYTIGNYEYRRIITNHSWGFPIGWWWDSAEWDITRLKRSGDHRQKHMWKFHRNRSNSYYIYTASKMLRIMYTNYNNALSFARPI